MRAVRRHIIQCVSTLAIMLSGCTGDGYRGTTRVTFTSAPERLAFAAMEINGGPWQVLGPSQDGTYLFEADETYGIVAVCADPSHTTVTVVHATVEETTSPSFACDLQAPGDVELGGAVTGLDDYATIIVPGNRVMLSSISAYSGWVPVGTWDLFALDTRPNSAPTHFVRKNAVSFHTGASTTVDFDFASEGVAFEMHSFGVGGRTADEETIVSTTLRTKPGGTSFTVGGYGLDDQGLEIFAALPESSLRDVDAQIVTATARLADRSGYRQLRRWFRTPEDFDLPLPEMPPASDIGFEATLPYLRMRAVIPQDIDADLYDLVYDDFGLNWTARLSRGYRDVRHPVAYSLPDLSELAGFDPSWGLKADQQVSWQVIATSSDASVAGLLSSDETLSTQDRTETMAAHVGMFMY